MIECLVAFVVLSIAVLAVLRWQAVMRLELDVARQRSHAVQQAHRTIEAWRAFSRLDPAADAASFADIATADDSGLRGLDEGASAEPAAHLHERRDVQDGVDARSKSVHVAVRWVDRQGAMQQVGLNSEIDGALPVHSAVLALPTVVGPLQRPSGSTPNLPAPLIASADGREVRWPEGARLQVSPAVRGHGSGTRGEHAEAAGAAGAAAAGAAAASARFMVTPDGHVQAQCEPASPDTAGGGPAGPGLPSPARRCRPLQAVWLSGHVRFRAGAPAEDDGADGLPKPVTVHLMTDTGSAASPPTCLTGEPRSAPASHAGGHAERWTPFTCLAPTGPDGWSGHLSLVPRGWALGPRPDQHRVCRFDASPSDGPGALPTRPHAEPSERGRRRLRHPDDAENAAQAAYQRVTGSLAQQNFVVVQGDRPCPRGSAALHNGGIEAPDTRTP